MRTVSASRVAPESVVQTGVFSLVLVVLGVQLQHALLGSLIWLALGAAGSWMLELISYQQSRRHRLLVLLGPGPLLALGVVVGAYLLARGGWAGNALVIAILLVSAVRWLGGMAVATDGHDQSSILPVVLLGSALFANSKEFPNLLAVGVSVMIAAATWCYSKRISLRVAAVGLVSVVTMYDVVSRPPYWWWSSDDTTTLSGIGTIIIERGRVADIAGWSTSEHHWLLHAWLALWNELSFGRVFETYLVVWPLVAAVSMFASLWLVIELFTGAELRTRHFAVVAVVVAGFVRLEWPAPQEQQPFLFGMVACSAIYLSGGSRFSQQRLWRQLFGVVVVVLGVPVMLFLLKPSLLVAYGLLITGTVLVKLGLTSGKRLIGAFVLSVSAVAAGVSLMRLGGSWVSNRSFASFAIQWFPEDLGWCRNSSVPGSFACVVSLQVPLLFTALLAASVLWSCRVNPRLAVSGVVMLPMVVAYLPLRYFVSSGVGSGAPSFYRLSEMALMVFIAVVVGLLLVTKTAVPMSGFALAGLVALVAVRLGEGPSALYDAVDSVLVKIAPLRFLGASDVIALCLLVVAAFAATKLLRRLYGGPHSRLVVVCLVFASMLPTARMIYATATSSIDTTRLSRPADFGPADIERLGEWLQKNTSQDVMMATNFLCPLDRLDECTNSPATTACAREQPALMASWALAALSKRDFYYLSQSWRSRPRDYFMHQRSVRLGIELSVESIRGLQDEGVSFFVASRDHTRPSVWNQLREGAVFATEHFMVVSLKQVTSLVAA